MLYVCADAAAGIIFFSVLSTAVEVKCQTDAQYEHVDVLKIATKHYAVEIIFNTIGKN